MNAGNWHHYPIQSARAFKNLVFFFPLITSFISIFGENRFLEFEIVHKVLKISKKLATSLPFGKKLRAAIIVVSCMTASANGTFWLLFPGCGAR